MLRGRENKGDVLGCSLYYFIRVYAFNLDIYHDKITLQVKIHYVCG